MEAQVIIVKCYKTKRLIGVRVQKMNDGDWWRTWAFPISERAIHNEGYENNKVTGHLYVTEEYPGCPHCKTKSFIQCNSCGKPICWIDEKYMVCPWCGNEMDNIGLAKEPFTLTLEGSSY